MAVVSVSNLLEAGVHFGHQTKRWNPKMKEYIYTTRDDIYIIDLQKTVDYIEESYEKILEIAKNGGTFLFVGTKKQAQEATIECATRSNSYYVSERWLGGTLTNFRTIRRRIKRLEDIEKMESDGTFEALPKKEVIKIKKEYEKLSKLLTGIRNMAKLPQAMIIVDPKKEYNAIREAKRLNIPVFGIVDTNGDPDLVDYVIPGNDDAVRSVKIVLGVLTNAICEANNLEMIDYVTDDGSNATMEDFNKENKKIVKKDEVEENNEEVEEPKEEVKKEKKEKAPKKETKKEENKEEDKLEDKTLAELKKMAKEKGIKGYSTSIFKIRIRRILYD